MTGKILFTSQVYLAKSKSPSAFRVFFVFLVKKSELSSSFIEASSDIGKKIFVSQAKNASKHGRITSLVGKEPFTFAV